MSIFASLAAPDGDEHADECARWDKSDDGCWEISDRPCDCGQPDAPLVYGGSHVLPSDDDERGGWVDIALIPSHITRDGRDDKPGDKPRDHQALGLCWCGQAHGIQDAIDLNMEAA